MARLERATPHGRVGVRGLPELLEAAIRLALLDHERGGAGIERIEFSGSRAWFKRSTLRGKARLRWAVKRALGVELPRVAEFENLSWLREHGFGAAVPLAAGVLVRAGLPLRQFLLTEDVPDAITLEAFVQTSSDPDRGAVLDELARAVARMHALGFVHHDLYPRNVLVRPASREQRIVFLDAWAGGPPPQARGAAYDMACLFLRADTELEPGEVRQFLERYAAERAARGQPVDADRLFASAKHERRKLVLRLAARPHERRGQALPSLDW